MSHPNPAVPPALAATTADGEAKKRDAELTALQAEVSRLKGMVPDQSHDSPGKSAVGLNDEHGVLAFVAEHHDLQDARSASTQKDRVRDLARSAGVNGSSRPDRIPRVNPEEA